MHICSVLSSLSFSILEILASLKLSSDLQVPFPVYNVSSLAGAKRKPLVDVRVSIQVATGGESSRNPFYGNYVTFFRNETILWSLYTLNRIGRYSDGIEILEDRCIRQARESCFKFQLLRIVVIVSQDATFNEALLIYLCMLVYLFCLSLGN